MHHADQQRADWQAPRVIMLVNRRIVLTRFSLVGVGMNMGDAVIVTVYMEVHPLMPKPVEHLQPEANQHNADGAFEPLC